MPTDLVTIAITAALTQFIGPGAKHLGEQALERAKQVASKAAGLLGVVGREPQPVEPRLLLPLVQAASLETDEILADKWAALLANAADPLQQQLAIHPSYVEVLRQLSSDDAHMLDFLDNYYKQEVPLPHPPTYDEAVSRFSWPNARPEASLENLLRLRLCVYEDYDYLLDSTTVQTKKVFSIPIYGSLFLAAVTPPMP